MSIDVFPATVLNSTLWNGQTYEEGTFTVTGTGFVTPPTGTAHYRRLGASVIIFLPVITGTSNATTFTLTGLPAALRPAFAGTSQNFVVRVRDNTTLNSFGSISISEAGVIDLYTSAALAAWTASGTKTLFFTSITYVLASALAAPGWTGQSYEEGTFTVTATGFSGTAPSGTARYVRVGTFLSIKIPLLTGTSNATTFTITGCPTALNPIAGQGAYVAVRGIEGVIAVPASVTIPANGIWIVEVLRSTPWAASGVKQLDSCVITYMLG